MKTYTEIYSDPKVVPDAHLCIIGKVIMGTFRFSNGDFASFVCGWNEDGLDHVSVAPFKKSKTPTWAQMCEVKDVCFYDNETAYQIHPAKSEYVNVVGNCLHLWARTDGKVVL